MYDDGHYQRGKEITSRHPNILRGVIIGKKSWGLNVRMWSEGIAEFSFTFDEIIYEFDCRDIKIPNSFLLDFRNQIEKLKIKKIDLWLEERSK